MKEFQVLQIVQQKLKFYTLIGDVFWHSRLNSGKVQTAYAWVQLCEAGTPDIIVIVKHINGGIGILFIECKRTGITELDYEQKIFFHEKGALPGVTCELINDPNQLYPAIKKAQEA